MRLGSLDSSDVSYVAGSVPRAFTEGGRPKRTQDQVAYGRADTPYVPRQAHGAVPESSWPPPFTPMRGLKGARAPRDDRSYLISRAPEPGITDFWWQLGFFRTIGRSLLGLGPQGPLVGTLPPDHSHSGVLSRMDSLAKWKGVGRGV